MSWSGAPIQSRSFKVLQKMTDTEKEEEEEEAQEYPAAPGNHWSKQQQQQQGNQPQQQHQQQYQPQQQQQQWGPQNTQGVPVSQLRKMQLNDDDRALMNKFKAQVPRGPTPVQQRVQQAQAEAPSQPYIPASEQQVQEPRKYTGGAIPSRSFRMLQAMTAPENCATDDSSTNPAHHQQWHDPNASPVPYYHPQQEYWGYYPPQNMEGQYWDPYSYMAYVNEMNAAYGYPPIPYPPVYSPLPYVPQRYPQRYHQNGSDSDEYSGYSSTDEMSYYGANFQRMGNPYQRHNGMSRAENETPKIVITPTNRCHGEEVRTGPESVVYSVQSENVATTDVILMNGQGKVDKEEGKLTKKDVKGVTEEDDSDTEVEDDDEEEDEAIMKIKAIKSVSNINVYDSDVGIVESNDEDTEQEDTDEEEDEEEEEEEEEEVYEDVEEDLPHQLSVIFEESEFGSDSGSIRKGKSIMSEDDSSTTTLDNDIDESDGNDDVDSESSSVTVRLPLRLKFTRSANDEEVTTVIVGDSQVNRTLDIDDAHHTTLAEQLNTELSKLDQERKAEEAKPLVLMEPVISDEDTDEEDFEDESDISVTFSIPSLSNSAKQGEKLRKDSSYLENSKSPVRHISPLARIENASNSPTKCQESGSAWNRNDNNTPVSVYGVSRQQSADDLDGYATCNSDSDVSVCLSLKVRKPSPLIDASSDQEEAAKTDESQSSSASLNTVKSVNKSSDSGSDTDNKWKRDERKSEISGQLQTETESKTEFKGFWETESEVLSSTLKTGKEKTVGTIVKEEDKYQNGPSLEIDIHIRKASVKSDVEEKIKYEEKKEEENDGEDDEGDSSESSESSEGEEEESSCSSDSSCSTKSCVIVNTSSKDVIAEKKEEVIVKEEVEISNVTETEESSSEEECEEGEYGKEEENLISKIYSMCIDDKVEEKNVDEVVTSEIKDTSQDKTKKPKEKGELSRNNSESGEEDDSGVTSDMSRPISDTESETNDRRKQTKYIRASTHSRLFRLLQDECGKSDDEDDEDPPPSSKLPIGALLSRREHLTLPLNNACSDPDSLSSSSGINSPISPTVTDRLVKELVQSLLQRKRGKRLKKLPMAKLHAAALRILQEDMDPYDTGSSAGSEDNCLSPARSSVMHLPKVDRTSLPPQTPYGTNYYDYCDYYNTWANAGEYYGDELEYDVNHIMPSRAFKLLSEHAAQPAGFSPGLINGMWAKCPRIPSSKNVRMMMSSLGDSMDTNPSSSSEPNSPLPPQRPS